MKKKTNILSLIVGGTACAVFGILLVLNLVIIIKGVIRPQVPPSVFGVMPMVVQSGSMSGSAADHIEVGDLIFVKKTDAGSLKEGDIISFLEDKTVVTHRIVGIAQENGSRSFTTKGDANNVEDQLPVTEDMVLGVYMTRIAGVGDFAMFLQKPLGMLLFIGVPLCAFILYDIIRRQRSAAREEKKTSELEQEVARLRRLAGEQEADPAPRSSEEHREDGSH